MDNEDESDLISIASTKSGSSFRDGRQRSAGKSGGSGSGKDGGRGGGKPPLEELGVDVKTVKHFLSVQGKRIFNFLRGGNSL